MFSNFQDEVLECIPTECVLRIFHFIFVNSIFDPDHDHPMGKLLCIWPITFEPKVVDGLNGYQSVCIVVQNRIIPNMTKIDLI